MSFRDAPHLTPRFGRLFDLLAILVMACAVVSTYWPPPSEKGIGLGGSDFVQLHQRRMVYAREALLGERHALPAWYPRELLGTPFWSNIQNFPFIPSRLIVLALFDPAAPFTYAIAVNFSAVLAALAAFAFCRAIGLGTTASAAAGWTFACCGYFASRVGVGHLPLLEAYSGLPLLLYIIEKLHQARQRVDDPTSARSIRRWLILLAATCCALALAGHPQLPIYSFATAGLYALWRGWGYWRGIARTVGVMAAGIGCAGFVLVPMLLLIARSTRVLRLDAPSNDIALPLGRILGFWLPWRDGAATPMARARTDMFRGYPNKSVFWDTIFYAGWMPWIALAAVCAWLIVMRRKPHLPVLSPRVGGFILAMGVGAVILALPFVQQITALIPGTLIRSPVRLLYITELALAVGLGVGIQLLVRHIRRPAVLAMILLPVLGIHFWDLRRVDREFMFPLTARQQRNDVETRQRIIEAVGNGRVAMEVMFNHPLNRRLDDAGFFDSIFLAKPYAVAMAVSGAVPGFNTQMVSAALMPRRALQFFGVRTLVTPAGYRNDVPEAGRMEGAYISTVPDAAPRAQFFSLDQIDYLDTIEIYRRLRDANFNLAPRLALPVEERPTAPAVGAESFNPAVEYQRPSSDRIVCKISTRSPGYLRIIESLDAGWSVTVSGKSAKLVPAWDCMLAVYVPPGNREVVFTYRTPGVRAGILVSVVSLVGVVALTRMTRSFRVVGRKTPV